MSFHQPRTMCELHPAAAVDEPLDRVGDLQLAARGGLDRLGGGVDDRREHVDADEREVGLRLRRLLDEALDGAVAAELRDAVVLGVGDRREEDHRVRAAGAELRGQLLDAALEEVVAEVHDERVRAEERLGGEDGVGEPERLVLDDVLDATPNCEPSPVAARISSPVSGAMMIPISSMPAAAIASMP